jgi:hypothetical protein
MNFSAQPCRISNKVTVQTVGDENLIYDGARNKAFCLNKISSLVWNLADGRRTPAQIADAVTRELMQPVSEEIVRFTLSELKRDGLLLDDSSMVDLHAVSRRQMVVKLGKTAAIMLPLVTAVFAPRAAKAYGGGCLLPDTPVHLADGSLIPASLVTPGQWLRGVDPASGEFHPARVASCHQFDAPQLLTFTTSTGELVKSSPSHLFIGGPGNLLGTRASEFEAGDSIMVFNPRHRRAITSTVTSIHTSQVPQQVVIFELDTVEHCFLSGGVVSHNRPIKQ